jgi:hypothetical protein
MNPFNARSSGLIKKSSSPALSRFHNCTNHPIKTTLFFIKYPAAEILKMFSYFSPLIKNVFNTENLNALQFDPSSSTLGFI